MAARPSQKQQCAAGLRAQKPHLNKSSVQPRKNGTGTRITASAHKPAPLHAHGAARQKTKISISATAAASRAAHPAIPIIKEKHAGKKAECQHKKRADASSPANTAAPQNIQPLPSIKAKPAARAAKPRKTQAAKPEPEIPQQPASFAACAGKPNENSAPNFTPDELRFLSLVAETLSLTAAARKSGLSARLFDLLETDCAFSAGLDRLINRLLEHAAIDTALKGNSALLTLLLTNRLAGKYRPRRESGETPEIPHIIFLGAEGGRDA